MRQGGGGGGDRGGRQKSGKRPGDETPVQESGGGKWKCAPQKHEVGEFLRRNRANNISKRAFEEASTNV